VVLKLEVVQAITFLLLCDFLFVSSGNNVWFYTFCSLISYFMLFVMSVFSTFLLHCY